jgi:hypothetical protein
MGHHWTPTIQAYFPFYLEKNTFLMIKINKINWLGVGLCREDVIRSRKFTRFNGCGQHGVYVMDNSGWIYAHELEDSNYKRLGFSFKEGDFLTFIYDPR